MFSLLYILKIVFKTTIVSNFEHISSTSKVNGLFILNSNIHYVMYLLIKVTKQNNQLAIECISAMCSPNLSLTLFTFKPSHDVLLVHIHMYIHVRVDAFEVREV